MTWQPIETAPKDEMVLLYRPNAIYWLMVAPGKWNSNQYAKTPKPYWECWLKVGGVFESRKYPPTLWMPLPPPPEEQS